MQGAVWQGRERTWGCVCDEPAYAVDARYDMSTTARVGMNDDTHRPPNDPNVSLACVVESICQSEGRGTACESSPDEAIEPSGGKAGSSVTTNSVPFSMNTLSIIVYPTPRLSDLDADKQPSPTHLEHVSAPSSSEWRRASRGPHR